MDPAILRVIDSMKLEVKPEYDVIYPEYLPVKITVKTSSAQYEKEVTVPKGHFKNPYNWKDLEDKGVRLIKDREKVMKIIEVGKSFEKSMTKELLETLNFE